MLAPRRWVVVLSALVLAGAVHADWPLYRKDVTRSNQDDGGAPFLEALWRQSLLRTDPITGDTGRWLKQANDLSQRHDQAVPSASSSDRLTPTHRHGLILSTQHFDDA